MMTDNEYSVPSHYLLVADRLDHTVRRMQDALKGTWAPVSCQDFRAPEDWVEPLASMVHEISEAVNHLGRRIMPSDAEPSPQEVYVAVQVIDKAVAAYIDHYRAMRQSPWPSGMEDGKLIVSAATEHILRDIHGMFNKCCLAIRDPQQAVVEYGSQCIDLTTTLSLKEEEKAILSWGQRKGRAGHPPWDERPAHRTSSGCFSSLLLGIFLGNWWGDTR